MINLYVDLCVPKITSLYQCLTVEFANAVFNTNNHNYYFFPSQSMTVLEYLKKRNVLMVGLRCGFRLEKTISIIFS